MPNIKQPGPYDLPEPIVTTLPNDIRWDETGLLPSAATFLPLPVEVPEWDHQPILDHFTILRLYWDRQDPVETRQWRSDLFPVIPAQDRQFLLPVSYLTPGIHALWYELTAPNSELYDSDKKTITIDQTAPILSDPTGSKGALIFDTDSVTEQYLIDNNDQLVAQVPWWTPGKPGDVLTWYLNSDPFNVIAADVVSSQTLERGDFDQLLSVVFTGDVIRARGDGERFAFYQVADRAGNVSSYAQAVRLDVSAQPSTRYLPSPRVAEAGVSWSSGVLSPFDAITGATVVIPEEAQLKPGDVLAVQWARPGTPGAFLATVADVTGKLFTVPPAYVPQHMGRRIPVYYQVTGNDLAQSDEYDLTVQILPEDNLQIIQCSRPAGVGTRLSLAAVEGFATFTLRRWVFMAVDQRLTVTLSGDGPSHIILDDYPVQATDLVAGQISTNAQKAVLQGFAINGPLNVLVKVSFDGGASTLDFPRLALTLVL